MQKVEPLGHSGVLWGGEKEGPVEGDAKVVMWGTEGQQQI